MARPKQLPVTVRNNLLPVRLSDVELEMFRSRAEESGVSISELMRRNGLMRPIPQRMSKLTVLTYRELSRIGTSINQIARAANIAVKSNQKLIIELEQLQVLKDLLEQCQRELLFGDLSTEEELRAELEEENDCED
jgi:hypothetical protein